MRGLLVVGFVLLASALAYALSIEQVDLTKLWHLGAFLIVIVGSFAVVLVQSSADALAATATLIKWLLWAPSWQLSRVQKRMVKLVKSVRANGALAADEWIKKQPNDSLTLAVKQAVMAPTTSAFQHLAQQQTDQQIRRLRSGVSLIESWAGYTPTLGIFGAVIGLIKVMRSIEDPQALGEGIATAFVATLYGIGAANLVLLPIAGKLSALVDQYELYHRTILQAVTAFSEGETEHQLVARLKALQ